MRSTSADRASRVGVRHAGRVSGEHEREHGGERPRGHDAAHWDERYSGRRPLWSVDPNALVADIVAPMAPGRALDLGAGEGRHATWLSRRGWQVTAVDFSAVGIERARSVADADAVEWIVDDVRTWRPPAGTTYDLVLIAFLHLADDVMGEVAGWLDVGGVLVVVGHALRNLTEGVGGPRDPALLHTDAQLRSAAAGLQIERLEEVLRPTSDGTAIDVLLVARRD